MYQHSSTPDRTLLITGVAGFIGSNLALSALNSGWQVRGLDNFSSSNNRNLTALGSRIEVLRADVCDLNALRTAFRGVDCVLHHAAIVSVPKSVEDPLTNHDVNATGTLNVLIAAREAGVRRVVFASSSAVYGDQSTLPIDEGSPANPLSPYAAAKLAGEWYSRIFNRTFGLETVCFRYFNVFGPHQDPSSPYSGVLARFILQMLHRERPSIFGDGEQTRDFTYVEDVVQANLLACAAPAELVNGRIFNIATGRRISLNEIYKILQRETDYIVSPSYLPPREADIRHSLADISAARELLGYRPAICLEDGLRRTVEWYRKQQAVASPRT